MVVGLLVCLGERVVVDDSGAVVAEAAEVGFRSLLLFNSHCHDFSLLKEKQRFERAYELTYLIVSKADFYFEFRGHHELVGVN